MVEDGADEHHDHEDVNQSALVLNNLCKLCHHVDYEQANAFLHEGVNQSVDKLVLLNNLCIFCHQVGSEQANAFLHLPAASEKGDGHDNDDDDDHDVESERVEGAVVVTGSVALIAHIVGVIEDLKEGGLVHQDPDPASQDSDAESLNSIL